MFVVLLVKVVRFGDKLDSFYLALGGACVGLWFAVSERGLFVLGTGEASELFTGLLVHDSLAVYIRILLLGFAVLFILFCKMTGLATRDDGARDSARPACDQPGIVDRPVPHVHGNGRDSDAKGPRWGESVAPGDGAHGQQS